MTASSSSATHSREALLAETPPEILAAAKERLKDPDLFKLILDDVHRLGVAGERILVGTLYLVGISRLLDETLAAIVQGPSSSGKSYLIEKVSSLVPPEDVCRWTDMTANALYYMPPGGLEHKLVVAGERKRRQDEETATSTKALREMLSSGKLSKSVVVRVEAESLPRTVQIEQQGPIAYLESTTLSKIFDEDANRCLLLTTDEQPEQTRKIIRREANRSNRPEDRASRDQIVRVHHTLQRLLVPQPVEIPYRQALAECFPHHRVEARRAFPQVLRMIQASALLHQFQREISPVGIVANQDDYRLTQVLLAEPLGRSLGGALSAAVVRFWNQLRKLDLEIFTAPEVAKALGVNEHTARDHLHLLHAEGVVELIEQNRGRVPAKWGMDRDATLAITGRDILPEWKDLVGLSEKAVDSPPPDINPVGDEG